MYCSSCGVSVATNLAYCNHCGAKITGERTDNLGKTTELRYESFVMSAMVAMFVLGMPAIGLLMGIMKAVLNFAFGPLIAFAFLSFFILIALEGVLVSRLLGRKRRADDASANTITGTHITKELEAQSRGFGQPVASVTDHTTRMLDPIYSERK
jgi:hypothetical protein